MTQNETQTKSPLCAHSFFPPSPTHLTTPSLLSPFSFPFSPCVRSYHLPCLSALVKAVSLSLNVSVNYPCSSGPFPCDPGSFLILRRPLHFPPFENAQNLVFRTVIKFSTYPPSPLALCFPHSSDFCVSLSSSSESYFVGLKKRL